MCSITIALLREDAHEVARIEFPTSEAHGQDYRDWRCRRHGRVGARIAICDLPADKWTIYRRVSKTFTYVAASSTHLHLSTIVVAKM